MLIVHKKPFLTGLFMAFVFVLTMVGMFLPIINGRNVLNAADDLFNSVSKQSSYYIPELRERARKEAAGTAVDFRLTLKDGAYAPQAAKLLGADGAQATAAGNVVSVKGDLGAILAGSLKDADSLFHNRGDAVQQERGIDAKQVMYARWLTLKALTDELKAKRQFDQASATQEVVAKGVEVAYNFYGIVPKAVSSNIGILTFSLVFYLVYTMWWGYAIMWLCDGMGLQMKGHAKREH